MTWALCFSCGHKKFGAICPCPECGIQSSGDINIDIAFSDHRISEESISHFGEVVKELCRVCDEPETRFYAFIHYVSQHHSSILAFEMKEEQRKKLNSILAQCIFPKFQVEPSEMAKLRNEMDENSSTS